MCLAIPMRVLEVHGTTALCEGRGGREAIDLALVGAQPPGTWVLTFLGAAREVLTEDAARQTEQALDALERALAGDRSAIDAAFADLVGREPQLPEHLRPEKTP